MRRGAPRVVALIVAGLVLGASVASAQGTSTSWDLHANTLALFSPGVAASTNAGGLWGSVAVVYSGAPDGHGRQKCIGVTGIAATIWAGAAQMFPATREQLILAGPTWGAQDKEGRLFLHGLAGVRRVTGLAGSSPNAKTLFTAGAGIAFDISANWRLFEIDWLVSPGGPTGMHRLIVSTGFAFGTRLTPKGPKPNTALHPTPDGAIMGRRG